jgi:oligoendopeptidase F
MTSAEAFLEHLNTTYRKLHKEYEEAFWLARMGDHAVEASMNDAQAKRDAFRADPKLKAETEAHIRASKGDIRDRLKLWQRFFSLYQAPQEATAIQKKISELESKIEKIRSTRKEGYIDPKTKKFVAASENKMRTIMRTSPDEAMRKACFDAMEKMPYDTLDLYIELIGLRNAFARALGHSDFYAYKARIDEDMTKKELFGIFTPIYESTKYGFKAIRDLEKHKPGLRKPWNFAYMIAGSFVAEEDPYFRFENVLSYWGRSFAALGLDFRGGTVSLDLLDRAGKYNNGFCHYPDLVHERDGKLMPGRANFTSNAIPGQVGSGSQGIHTVFHEGGHAMDRLNSRERDVCVNTEYPPATVSWAETHSMFMDTISSSIEWRTRYARNAEGEPYPFDLYERKVRAVLPLRPLEMMHIMFVVFFEKEIYECRDLTRERVLEMARRAYKKYFDQDGDSIRVLNVPHIYTSESSAYYHGYGLALLGVEQWREYFFKKYGYIVDNPRVGAEMTKVWSYASRYSAKKLVRMATGKKLSADAFIRNATKPLDRILRDARARIDRLKKVPEYTKPVDLGGSIVMVHGKKKIADNSRSFEDMDGKYRAWLRTMK